VRELSREMPALEPLVRRKATLPRTIQEKTKLVDRYERDADVAIRAESPKKTRKKRQLRERKERDDRDNGVSRAPERVLVRVSAVHVLKEEGSRVQRFLAVDGDGDLQVVTREQGDPPGRITVDPLAEHTAFRPGLEEVRERASFALDGLRGRAAPSGERLRIIRVWSDYDD
jgi:hypothetical protein